MVWNMPGQGFWMQMLPALPAPVAAPCPFVVENDGVDARHAGAGAARFHGPDARQGAAEEAAGFGLPPGVDDDGLALAHDSLWYHFHTSGSMGSPTVVMCLKW
jgi:hypothetical protein